ncbi:MAG TPA: NAD-dependent protein deacylase [Anaerolineaceae bacterium]|jgi:NAD-dependent deacetylase|nr:NAD-dependent protein deacylase [Anaerolineaceae bacterium]
MNEKINLAREFIKSSDNIVFLGGAGVSTASGIPDFRSATGLYNRAHNANYSPEYLLSYDYFKADPKGFYTYLRENLYYPDAQPNAAHYALAKLEKLGKLKAVITQNIDNFHQRAGSSNVLELHGTMEHYYCIRCHKDYDVTYVMRTKEVPLCTCGGIVRPDVVLYGEMLNTDVLNASIKAITRADMFIIGGTSLVVYPAAALVRYYRGDKLLLINQDPTAYDNWANLVIAGDISQVMASLVEDL